MATFHKTPGAKPMKHYIGQMWDTGLFTPAVATALPWQCDCHYSLEPEAGVVRYDCTPDQNFPCCKYCREDSR